MTSLSRRSPSLACSLIRRTFRTSGVTPDLCHVQWHGPSCSALPPDEARSLGAPIFSSPTGDSSFSDDFFRSVSLRFASLTSLHESGRFDAPFSYELVAALSKCHESAPGADCLPYSLFKVSFPWWRHLLLSFFNLVLRFRPHGSPALSFRSSSEMVTPLLLIPTASFLSHLALSNFLSTSFTLALPPTFFHNSTLPRAVSAGVPTPWPSASYEHTFVALIDTKKAFDSCWVEATLVRLFD